MSLRESPVGDDIAKRLSRIAGHASSLKRMWDEGTDCDDLLTQVSAVRAALDQVGKVILEHHIEECVGEAIRHADAEDAIRDLKRSLDRLF